jgi:hypothetical protein
VDWEPTHRLVGGISRVGRRRKVTTMRRGKMEEKRVVQEGGYRRYSLYGYGEAGRLGGGVAGQPPVCKFDISQPPYHHPPTAFLPDGEKLVLRLPPTLLPTASPPPSSFCLPFISSASICIVHLLPPYFPPFSTSNRPGFHFIDTFPSSRPQVTLGNS